MMNVSKARRAAGYLCYKFKAGWLQDTLYLIHPSAPSADMLHWAQNTLVRSEK